MEKIKERFLGDTYPIIFDLTINDEPADLTSVVSVNFSYAKRGDEKVVIAGEVEDASAGVVKFDISEDDFNEEGDFFFDIEVNYSDNVKRTFTKDKIKILGRV